MFLKNKGRRLACIFIALSIFLGSLMSAKPVQAAKGGKNVYLAVYFDESACTYRYEAVESGRMLEYSHVASLLPEGKLNLKKSAGKWYLHGLQMAVKESDKRECVSNVKVADSGYIELAANKGGKAIKDFDKIDSVTEKDCLALTFPGGLVAGNTYSERDLQRCNEIISSLCSDFSNALTYINDGNAYTDQDYFHKMALALVSTSNGGTLTNGYGHQYKIEWLESETELHGYAKYCKITGVSDSYLSGSQTFIYKVRKGYKGGDAYGDTMENGMKNKVFIVDDELRDKAKDTYWISWEHLFLEGEMLYAQGITYANKNDLYEDSSWLNTLQDGLSKQKNTFLGDLAIHSALQLVYNSGIYGSDAYVFGIYKQITNNTVFTIFLAFAAIMISLLSVSIIKMINERQTLATYNSMSRANLLNDAKNMIICLMCIAFSWLIFKLLFMLNFYFVKIWAAFLNDNYSFVYTNGMIAGDGLLQLVMIGVYIYIDVLYVLRSIFVPILMASAPLFLFLYTFGGNFQRITFAWFKELLGAVFVQAIHAFVLTFVLVVAQDTRGLTQIIVWASIIPLTKMFRDMCGLGGKELFAAAKGLTASAAALQGSMAEAGGAAVGGVLGAGAGIVGGAVGSLADAKANAAGFSTNMSRTLSNFGQQTGSAIGRFGGSSAKAMVGAGEVIASGGEDGSSIMASGISGMGNSIGQGVGALGGLTAGGISRNSNRSFADSVRRNAAMGPSGFHVANQGAGGFSAAYNGPSPLNGADFTTNFETDGKNGVASATFSTGMTMDEIRSRYERNGLGGKSYESLKDGKDILAKLAMATSNMNDMESSRSAVSQTARQVVGNQYQSGCKYGKFSSMEIGHETVTNADGKATKLVTLVGKSDVDVPH